MLIGLFITFFGLKLFHISVFLISAVAGTLICLILFFEFVKFGPQDWILYVILGASIIIGCAKGYLVVKFEKFGFFLLGAYLGVVGGLFLFNAIIAHFANSAVPFYVTLSVAGLIGGLLSFWLWKDMIIIATSIIGGYLTIRSISFWVGNFPNEIQVAEGEAKLNAIAYAYLAGALFLALFGMYVQFKMKSKDSEKENDKEEKEAINSYYAKA